MARLRDVRERIHQPKFDTLVRGIGESTVNNMFQLFGNANIGNRALTNLQVPGQLAADATYVVKAVRCVLWFQSLADDAFGGTNGTPDFAATAQSTGAEATDLYSLCAYGAYFTLSIGQKQMLNGPLWYVPAGGGISGFTTENNRSPLTNGVASQEAILKLARDIPIAVRQNFGITVEFFPFEELGDGIGGAYPGPLSPLDMLNASDAAKLMQFHIDGIETRDVQ